MAKRRRQEPRRTTRIDLDDIEPVVIHTGDRDGEEVEEIHLFTIDDREYWVPARAPFQAAIKSMSIYAAQGEAAAVDYQLRTMLGEEAYEALVNCPDVTEDQFKRICDHINTIVMAEQEGKAESPGDSNRSAGSRGASTTSSRTRTRTTTSTSPS